ncbi:unnamed protein product [Owenia fusiformis]|uniref:G-protein coupled receptors family 1 profile domain-containing protein n=1 Tax=Owenia fusiformis TaxID=6347 RepID=A0A8S4NM90_OWEFU|nr:unnamed protein product [Owenia fusiformis]
MEDLLINGTLNNITNNTNSTEPEVLLFITIFSIYLPALIGVFGIVGNALSFIILLHERHTSTFYLLRCLAVSDTLFLLCAMQIQVTYSIITNYYDDDLAYDLAKKVNIPFIWPIAMAAQMSSVWLTVFISIERYIAVCHPFKAKYICTIKTARSTCVGIMLGCLLYNLPRFFEYLQINDDGHVEYTFHNKSEVGDNMVYRYMYCAILYFLLLFCVPLMILLVLNIRIVYILNREKHLSPAMTISQKKEHKVTKISLCIVLVFFLCGTLSPVTNFQDAIAPESFQENNSDELAILTLVSNLLVFVNSSVNFLVYCWFGGRFRARLRKMFQCSKHGYTKAYSFSRRGTNGQTYIMSSVCEGHHDS